MSRPPSASTASATKRSLDSRVGDVEVRREVAVQPVDPPRPDRDLDPASWSAFAIAAPKPLDAPVTIAVLPSREMATVPESIPCFPGYSG